MEVVSIQSVKVVGYDSASHSGLDIKQIIFTNLHLLGFDSAAMEVKYKIPFNKEMFNLPNKAGAEAVLYFLFNTLNPTLCRQEFRDCWPVIDKKSESTFRKVCCIWLQNIQKDEADSRLPRINASLFLSPGGDKFYQLLFSFSTYVLLHIFRTEYCPKESLLLGFPTMTSQNKELGEVMETTCTCAAIRHRKHFFETLAKTVTVKSQWQSYSDEAAKNIRILSKEVKDLVRSKREQLLQVSVNETAISSLSPGGKQFQDVKSVSHSAKRMKNVQMVRGMWKNLETYIDRSQEERDIVSSIVDRTLQKFVIDAATVNISIPHLMLRECEQEIKRRNIDNIYDGGKLNLLSVLQLWNLALKMYIHRLNDKGLRDLSEEACDLKSQVHSHQAYLANTAALRDKITKDIPQRKRNIEYLRSNFSYNEVNQSGLGMIAPSPPSTFESSRGQHTGATPTGPILQKTPDYAKTPEVALDIVEMISQTSRKNKVAPYHASTFGIADSQNLNRNNSSSSRIPQPCHVIPQDKTKGGQTSMNIQDVKSNVRHRVVQHVNQQTASTLSSHKTTASSTKKPSGPSRQHASSNLKNVKRLHIESVSSPADHNNSATETPQQRAHEILAERIVWSVMHEEKKPDKTPRSKGSKSQLLHTALFASKNVISPLSSPVLPVTFNRHSQRAVTDQINEHSPLTLHELEHFTAVSRDLWKTSVKGKSMSSDVSENMVFDKAKSPVTQVHQDQLKGAEGASHVQSYAIASLESAVDSSRTQADNQQLCFEEEDASLANPVAAFGDDAFVSHDLIHRSPAAAHIQRMWKEAISSCIENQDLSPAEKPGFSTNDSTHTDTLPQSQTLHGNVTWPKGAFTKGAVSESNVTDLRGDNSQKTGDLTTETTDKNSPVAVNGNLLFMDSDEERQQEPMDAERSAVEWEDCMSALYCDDDIGRVDHTKVVAALGLDSDLDEFFKTVTPYKRTAVGSDPTKENHPLISFTPENSILSATENPKDSSKNMLDKVNLDDLKLKHVVDSDQQSHSALINVHKLTGTVKTIYSAGGYSTSEPKTNDDDDDLVTSEASLLNESFTPLHAGLFVRGRTSPEITPRREPASIHKNHLDDDDVAAQLMRLRKITAEVFKMDRSLAVPEHPETKVFTKPVSPSTPMCTDTGQRDSGEFNTVGILEEDETVLLPASPL